jgi:hypothetical protein
MMKPTIIGSREKNTVGCGRNSVGYYAGSSTFCLIKGIAKRHKVVGLERPAHKRKLARAIWDVVYY